MNSLLRLGKMVCLLVTAMLATSAFAFAAEPGTDWDNQLITVTGTGAAPQNAVNPAQARMLARRAAVADGYRQLADVVRGVQVDSETTVESMMVTSDIVKTKVSAMIQGARVVSERVVPGDGYEVTMQVSMFGVSNSVASAVITPPAEIKPFPAPAPEVIPSLPADSNDGAIEQYGTLGGNANASPMATIGGYTGLIVDCRGLGLQPVMSPVIKNEKGIPIYGHENLNYDLVVKDGMVGYAKDRSMASRAGARPLVMKAVALMDHNANPVLSVADANRVLIENGASGFLNQTHVVLLR